MAGGLLFEMSAGRIRCRKQDATQARAGPGGVGRDLRTKLSATVSPHLAKDGDERLLPPAEDAPTEFEFGLALILDGLGRLLDASRATDAAAAPAP